VESHRPHHDRMYDLKPTERDDRPQAAVNAARIDKAVAPRIASEELSRGQMGLPFSPRMAAAVEGESTRPNGSARASTSAVWVVRARASAGRGGNASACTASGDGAHASSACARRRVLSCQSHLRVGFGHSPGDGTNRPTHTCRVCRIAQLIVRCLQNMVPIACLSERTLRTSPRPYNRTRPHAGTTVCNGL
jgi:hypothetical protein